MVLSPGRSQAYIRWMGYFRVRLALLSRLVSLTAFAAALPLAAGAGDGPELPEIPYSYSSPGPVDTNYSASDNTPPDNPVTDAGATLGRVLFYDRQLSANGLVSCGSCHSQSAGFDDQSRFSIGFKGQITKRSAMALGNARFNPRGRYFRDERAATLEEQVLVPFADEIEMGLMPGQLISRINSREWYQPLFENAFGDAHVTEDRIAASLAQFVRAMTANRTRYDRASDSTQSPLQPFPSYSDAENRGKHLFFADHDAGGAGCASCHVTDAFIMAVPKNNGVDARIEGNDGGIGAITGSLDEQGLFRTASLKNITLTAPYMHDGRFSDLDAVLDHYSRGIKPHPNLSSELRDEHGKPIRFDFTQSDKEALKAFLETLTDYEFVEDVRFSDPFLTKGTGASEE